MAAAYSRALLSTSICTRNFHVSSVLSGVKAGRYKVTKKRDRPLTYEQSLKPHEIAHSKAWKSWNTSNLLDGIRPSESAIEDTLIRKFMYCTWHGLFVQDVIVKRRHNTVVIAGIVHQNYQPRKMYFLIGYTEEILAYILQCPVKLELQTVADKKDVIFKYI